MSKMYYHYDGHGSVERVHGKDGSSCKLMYDTYGNLTAGIIEQWNIWYNDIFAHRTTMIYAYSGEAYNCISELQYLRARWYDTEIGRFLSEDRYLGNQRQPLTRNRYLYTCNNPMNYVDPSGYKAVAQDVGGFGVMRQSALTGGVGLALAAFLEETKKKVKAQKNTNRQNNNSSDKQSSTSQTSTNSSSLPLAGVTQATMDSLAQKVEEAKNRQENDLCEGNVEREITFPREVYGEINGAEVILTPITSWWTLGAAKSGLQKDENGRYLVAVGPKILDSNYPDDGKIWKADFEGKSSRINVVLAMKDNFNEQIVIECVVDDIKAHTYNTYPDGHKYDTLGRAYFNCENGYFQTGISYPKSINASQNLAFTESNVDSSVIEFVGTEIDFNANDYELVKVLVMKE